MANWLQKFIPPAPPAASSRNLPSMARQNPPPAGFVRGMVEGIPNASLIYGLAASALFVIALYFVLTGHWITGLLVLMPAACFLGYALHFLKFSR
jgi:hypothetical protein